MKNILIPTDFSEVASYAIDMAMKIQEKIAIKITLLHVITKQKQGEYALSEYASNSSTSPNAFKETHQHCSQKLDKLKSDLPVNTETQILEGELNEVIINFIKEKQIDLVIMGTKGTSNRELGGSETEIIVRRSTVPVLSLMSQYKKSDFKNILFINDFKNEIEIDSLKILKSLVTLYDAHLHFLKITDDNESELVLEKNMCDFAKKNKLQNVKMHFYNNNDGVEAGIETFLDKHDFDMLCIGTHRHLGFNHWKRSSIAEDLVNHLNKPILTFHLPEE